MKSEDDSKAMAEDDMDEDIVAEETALHSPVIMSTKHTGAF